MSYPKNCISFEIFFSFLANSIYSRYISVYHFCLKMKSKVRSRIHWIKIQHPCSVMCSRNCVWCMGEQRPFFSCTTSLCYCLIDIHGDDSSYSLLLGNCRLYNICLYYSTWFYNSITNPGNYRGNVFIMRISLSKTLGPVGLSHGPEIT